MIQVTHDIITDNILAPLIQYTANPIMNPNIKQYYSSNALSDEIVEN